jgi:hypothetical protein
MVVRYVGTNYLSDSSTTTQHCKCNLLLLLLSFLEQSFFWQIFCYDVHGSIGDNGDNNFSKCIITLSIAHIQVAAILR